MPAAPIDWSPTEGDRIVLTNRLRATGLSEEAVEVAFLPRYGLTSVAVAVPVEAVPELGPRVEEVLREVVPPIGQQLPLGVSFALADCTKTLVGVREAAFADAVISAESLAQAAGRQLGPAIAISEELENSGLGQRSSACPQSPSDLFTFGNSAPAFDSSPEVSVSVRLSVTFALESQEVQGATVAAVGTATVTAEADVAYLVVTASSSIGDTLTRDLRWDEMVAGLRALGIAEDAVSVSSSFSNARVAVRVSPAAADGLADSVLPLLRAYARVIQADGVAYAVSDCDALVSAARTAAIQNAAESADGLAVSLGGSLGPVVSVSPLVAPFDECPTGLADGDLVPPSSPARVTIQSALQVTFSVEPE
jgi:uncharacterized protein YggE